MTDSRAKPLVIAALLAPFVFANPAAAQWSSDKPPVLHPDDYPPVADAPEHPQSTTASGSNATTSESSEHDSQATEPPRSLDNTPGVEAATLPAVGPAVQVGSLGTAEGPAVGTLDSSNGGLGPNLWSGSERGTAEDLLARAPLANADPVLRSLTKRLVLTRATAPVGAAKHAFLTVRLRKLLKAGLLDDAGAIASQATLANDEEFARTQADALLYDNRNNDVCGNATATRLTASDPFWMELRTYCAAAGGDQPTADLTRSVLQAQGQDDPAFETLLDDVLNHKNQPPGPIAAPNALHVFLLQQAGLAIPDDVIAKLGAPAAMVAIHGPQNSSQSKFAAAERLIRTGAVQVAQLKVLADAQDIPLSHVADAAVEAQSLPFLQGQVLLRRAAVIEQRPDARTELAGVALSLGEKHNLLPLAAAFQSEILTTLKPLPVNPRARLIARALLLNHNLDAAALWLDDKDVLQTVGDLVSNDPAREARLQAIYAVYADSLSKNPPDPDPDRAYKALVLGMADALGQQMSPNAKLEATSIEAQQWDGKRPDAGMMRSLEKASGNPDRRGEALLMILDTVSELGLRDMAPDVSIEFVRQLGYLGLPDSARALALDAMAQYEPPPPPPPPTTAAAQ